MLIQKIKKFVQLFIFVACFFTSTIYAAQRVQDGSWDLYFGFFGGAYFSQLYGHSHIIYNYSNGNVRNGMLDVYTIQDGTSFLGGGLFGFVKQISEHWYMGADINGTTGTNYSRLSTHVSMPGNPPAPVDATNQIRLNYQFNISGIAGFDVTPLTFFYGKVGVAYAVAKNRLTINVPSNPGVANTPATAVLENTQPIGGVVFGLGLTRILARHFSLFAEYNYYFYANGSLDIRRVAFPSLANFSVQSSGRITESTLVVGINFHIIT